MRTKLFSPHKRLLIKIIPHRAGSIYKLEFPHTHIAVIIACAAALILAGVAFHINEVRAARAQLQTMRSVDAAQQRELESLTRQTTMMWRRLEQLKRSNEEVKRLTAAASADLARRKRLQSTLRAQLFGGVGGGEAAQASMRDNFRSSISNGGDSFSGEAAQLALLNYDMTRTLAESGALRDRAQRVVRAKQAAELAQQRFLDSIPSIWPTSGFVSSGFGYRTDPDVEFHAGLDVVNDYGAPVYATAAGIVAEAGWDGGYGNKMVIDHGNGYETWYAHNSRLLVTAGQQVRKGQQIALVGATGFATGPHVHYEVLLWGKPIDPTQFLNGIPAQLAAAR